MISRRASRARPLLKRTWVPRASRISILSVCGIEDFPRSRTRLRPGSGATTFTGISSALLLTAADLPISPAQYNHRHANITLALSSCRRATMATQGSGLERLLDDSALGFFGPSAPRATAPSQRVRSNFCSVAQRRNVYPVSPRHLPQTRSATAIVLGRCQLRLFRIFPHRTRL
jgi:hypothetical protein